jgi:hypothetical protein
MRRARAMLSLTALVFLLTGIESGFAVVLYQTGFEASEGYNSCGFYRARWVP